MKASERSLENSKTSYANVQQSIQSVVFISLLSFLYIIIFDPFLFPGYPSVYGPTGAASLYNASVYNFDIGGYGKEDIYSGSKSMYTKSPPLPRSTSLSRSQSVYTRPAPPRTDNYYRNLAQQQQNLTAKSTGNFPITAGLLEQENERNLASTAAHFGKSNTNRNPQESLYVTTSKPLIVKPEPVYGVTSVSGISNYSTTKHNLQQQQQHPDSGDSSYSTYRGSGSAGSGSYTSSRSSGNNPPLPPLPVSRNHRSESQTPNSIISAHSGLTTPISITSFHSPNPQY